MSSKKKPTQVNKVAIDLEAQINELTYALQRERADALNLKRRHDEDLNKLRYVVKANVLRELLPAIDNLERALKHVPKDLENNNYVKGVKSVVNQFDKTLSDMGIEKIKTVGEKFNPELHEAVSMEHGGGRDEIITEELQSGYKVSGHVIRHAMVNVKM